MPSIEIVDGEYVPGEHTVADPSEGVAEPSAPNAAAAASPLSEFDLIRTAIDAAGTPGTQEWTDTTLALVLPSIWNLYADKDAVYPRLRYYYTLRQVIDIWLASVWRDVDESQADVKQSLTDQSKNLQALRDNAHAEIEKLEMQARAGQSAVIGLLPAPGMGGMRHGAGLMRAGFPREITGPRWDG